MNTHTDLMRTNLSRRMVLRGLGTALALPFLESMIPTRLFGAKMCIRDRVVVVFPRPYSSPLAMSPSFGSTASARVRSGARRTVLM